MRYFFILGNNPTLSTAEISAVFKGVEMRFINNDVLLLDIDKKIEADVVIKRLGGTIKIGVVEKNLSSKEPDILAGATESFLKPGEGKFKFGISYYGSGKINAQKMAMNIKRYLKSVDASCRWVTSKEKTLSSVVVEQNKLSSKGIEIVLIDDGGTLLLGRTLAVQPFKELSYRDYGRPARDNQSGMLPPKLAQIMINLAEAPHDAVLLDPFCGSGTILTEATLMGYKNLVGADVSDKATKDTKQNIEWIKLKYQISFDPAQDRQDTKYEILNLNATHLSKTIQPNSVDAIVTEPYLGPQRGKIEIKNIVNELNALYTDALKEFKKILKPGGRIVMIFPVFKTSGGDVRLSPGLKEWKKINSIPTSLQHTKFIKLTDRKTIIYGRAGQRVWREIVVLEK